MRLCPVLECVGMIDLDLDGALRALLDLGALGAEFVQIFSFEKLRIGCKQLVNPLRFSC